ncbi:hypothetical protein WCX49_05385 [Sulfurimonas sp. HSL-1656]|uniref:hypothetical protein n=1 Tax=Thiomicrolovo subterrani TaxID=3131934 RepID=UPI0031F8FF31
MKIRQYGLRLLGISALMVSGSLYAGQVSGMTTFTPGTTAYASEVNDNFTEHTNQINDNDTRITANATAIQNNTTAIANSGLIKYASLSASCPALVDVGTTYTKIATIGSYSKAADDTVLNVVFSGRIKATSTTGAGVIFELRVDDTATTVGRIRGIVKATEVGSSGVAATMEGFFTNLSAGSHTVSMWARSSSGSAIGTQYDPGCWQSDSVIIKEFK